MDFGQTEMERALRDPLERFLGERYDFQTRRKRLAADAWTPDIWRALASELGVLGAGLPEEVGGLGGGAAEAGAVMEAFGRHLVVEPFLSTVVMGAGFLQAWTSPAAPALLAQIAEGAATVAVAHAEPGGGYEPTRVALRATPSDGGFVLNGAKTLVLHAAQADHLVIVARTAGEDSDPQGISIFLTPATADGITRKDYRTIDGGPASDLTFEDVFVPGEALIGPLDGGGPLVERILDEATAAICAEACGVMQSLLDQTVAYTRQRRQFGRAISEFQVLQHRMVDMLIEVKQAASLAMVARIKLDTPDRAAAVSAAKSRIGRACKRVSQAAVQLHGGIGIADETPVSHYFRRALMIERQFGSADYHLDRYERLQIENP
ncbi:MAG: acyl-CoA dehydrogenase domain protein [Phenylobacterium sp.]|nr:acyl-CoA dehydrogenase domain protein [Phenylobacterium sp.]